MHFDIERKKSRQQWQVEQALQTEATVAARSLAVVGQVLRSTNNQETERKEHNDYMQGDELRVKQCMK